MMLLLLALCLAACPCFLSCASIAAVNGAFYSCMVSRGGPGRSLDRVEFVQDIGSMARSIIFFVCGRLCLRFVSLARPSEFASKRPGLFGTHGACIEPIPAMGCLCFSGFRTSPQSSPRLRELSQTSETESRLVSPPSAWGHRLLPLHRDSGSLCEATADSFSATLAGP